ncbi:MAG: heavy-metal-associated domain-containing protein [Gemmatimonadales bacterium]|nr:heavy-metal-associated domain-containing protein [Gemmatimonadales bacterium]
MISWLKLLPVLAAGVGSAAFWCPLCDAGPAVVRAESLQVQSADTASVRLHISRMTCGSCPVTARVTLNRLAGVYGATVTLEDSLGIVRYDPRRVTPEQIAAHLTRATGFGATILPDTTTGPRGSGGA